MNSPRVNSSAVPPPTGPRARPQACRSWAKNRHGCGSCSGTHELRDMRRSKTVATPSEVKSVRLLGAQVYHLAKSELRQSNCKVPWADASEPGFASSGRIFCHLAGGRCFFRPQIGFWKHEAKDDRARCGERSHYLERGVDRWKCKILSNSQPGEESRP